MYYQGSSWRPYFFWLLHPRSPSVYTAPVSLSDPNTGNSLLQNDIRQAVYSPFRSLQPLPEVKPPKQLTLEYDRESAKSIRILNANAFSELFVGVRAPCW